MGLQTTRAVVAGSLRISNTSKLVTLITERRGLVKVMARGARRPTSRFGAALEPITVAEVIYYAKDNREIQTLSSADIIEAYPRIKADLRSLAAGTAMIEAAQTVTAPDDPSAGTFPVLVEALDGLEDHEGGEPEKRFWRFMLKLLSAVGYRPVLDRCSVCGNRPRSPNVFFSHADGGIICSCSDPGGRYGFLISPGSLMAMKSLMNARDEEITRIRLGKVQRREIEHAVLKFFSWHTGSSRPPRSLAFMRKVDAYEKPADDGDPRPYFRKRTIDDLVKEVYGGSPEPIEPDDGKKD